MMSFTLEDIPSTVSVLEPFTIDWSSDPTTDPVNITIIIYDTIRTRLKTMSLLLRSKTYKVEKDRFHSLFSMLVLQTVTITAAPYPTANSTFTSSLSQGIGDSHNKIIIGEALGGFFALLIGALAALFCFGRYRVVPVARQAEKYQSETCVVENTPRVQDDRGSYHQGEVGEGDLDGRPPSYDDVHSSH
ncbi:hypothetical protein L218DRAFT_950043 [Marasmius fiardii PR-910]|nr:hypothetical protein L218DRAFT_950043 [Marasmius fiardii PR-910]